LVGGTLGGQFGLEKFKVGSASDPRPDIFPGGTNNSLIFGPSMDLHLAYYDSMAKNLKYAHRLVNGQWSAPVTVDVTPYAGTALSISVTGKDEPEIAYHDGINHALKLARTTDFGKTWSIRTIDSNGTPGCILRWS